MHFKNVCTACIYNESKDNLSAIFRIRSAGSSLKKGRGPSYSRMMQTSDKEFQYFIMFYFLSLRKVTAELFIKMTKHD